MSNNIEVFKECSLDEAKQVILHTGHLNTIHLVGGPGIGKTSMAQELAKEAGLRLVFIDAPNTDMASMGIYMPNHETETTTFYANEHFGFHKMDPILLFIDEFTKASTGLQNLLHPALNERRMVHFPFHPKTIVVTTGNHSLDGVGDAMKGHTRNRITEIPVRGADYLEWINWGYENKIHPLILAFGRQFRQVFASYRDAGQEDNNYIYHPKRSGQACITQRSLAKASNIMWARDHLTDNALGCALAGTIGHAGAGSLMGFIHTNDELPTIEEIIEKPEEAKVPTSGSAQIILCFNALATVDNRTIKAWFKYAQRLPKEALSVFVISARRNPKSRKIMESCLEFAQWISKHEYLFDD